VTGFLGVFGRMDSFEFNKFAGALLFAALVAFGLGVLSDVIFEGREAEAPGYIIEVAGAPAEQAPVAEAPAADAPMAAPEVAADAPKQETAMAAPGTSESTAAAPFLAMIGDMAAEDGKKVAKKCVACHSFDEGGKNKVGPPLWGILNRIAGAGEGFKYSAAMKTFGENGGTWDYAALDGFLADPKGEISGTKMSFAGLKKEKDRAAILAYLRTLAAEPVPLP
jgi:cytochrome c